MLVAVLVVGTSGVLSLISTWVGLLLKLGLLLHELIHELLELCIAKAWNKRLDDRLLDVVDWHLCWGHTCILVSLWSHLALNNNLRGHTSRTLASLLCPINLSWWSINDLGWLLCNTLVLGSIGLGLDSHTSILGSDYQRINRRHLRLSSGLEQVEMVEDENLPSLWEVPLLALVGAAEVVVLVDRVLEGRFSRRGGGVVRTLELQSEPDGVQAVVIQVGHHTLFD